MTATPATRSWEERKELYRINPGADIVGSVYIALNEYKEAEPKSNEDRLERAVGRLVVQHELNIEEVFDREPVVPGGTLQMVLVGGWTRQPLSGLFLRIGCSEGIVLTDGETYLKWERGDNEKGLMLDQAAAFDRKHTPFESCERNPATQFVAACETYELIALASDETLSRI